MRRVEIHLEEDLDDRLRAEAVREGRSKASLIRDCVAAKYRVDDIQRDPITALVGSVDQEPAEDIDEVIYGR